MGTPAELLQPILLEPAGPGRSRARGCMPGPLPPAVRNRQLQAAEERHAQLSEAAAALAYLHEQSNPDAEAVDPAALAAAAELLGSYVRRALCQQHLRQQAPARPQHGGQLLHGPGR